MLRSGLLAIAVSRALGGYEMDASAINALWKAPQVGGTRVQSLRGGKAVVTTTVQCETSKGPLTIQARPDWAPHGAKRFLRLVRAGFFTNLVFYRVPPLGSNPIAQFGTAQRRAVRAVVDSWGPIKDEASKPGSIPQMKGALGFGGGGPNTRTCHMWVARETFAKVICLSTLLRVPPHAHTKMPQCVYVDSPFAGQVAVGHPSGASHKRSQCAGQAGAGR